jgi:pyruvate dehydrogenase E2 component (dihydrolipoamide acetyltransferase)
MASDVLMPRLSDSMEEGTVLKWLVDVGGEVKRGEPLAEIETDKANMTYESDADGVLVEVLAEEGQTLAVGEVIARIGEEGEAPGAQEEPEPDASGEAEQAAPEGEADEPAAGRAEPEAGQAEAEAKEPEAEEQPAKPQREEGERLKASPVARRMAGELGVDLGSVEGTGPGGRIVKSDVEAAAEKGGAATEAQAEKPAEDEAPAGDEAPVEDEAPAKDEAPPKGEAPVAKDASPAETTGQPGPTKGEPQVVELTRLQRTVSRRMAESKATAPDFALSLDVDMTLCIELRERLKEQTEHAPSFNDMVVKAAALALRDHPKVNGAYRDGKFELYPRVNVGVAVAAQETLVVPVVRDADEKSLGEVSRQARRLIGLVREGKITPPDLSGGTFTVSNLGMYGIERFTGVINPPQAAILTVGALVKKPAVDERGSVVARDLMNLTMVCDHRILYGADGAEFLAAVRKLLEAPLSLAL